jgi:hypothetical protein
MGQISVIPTSVDKIAILNALTETKISSYIYVDFPGLSWASIYASRFMQPALYIAKNPSSIFSYSVWKHLTIYNKIPVPSLFHSGTRCIWPWTDFCASHKHHALISILLGTIRTLLSNLHNNFASTNKNIVFMARFWPTILQKIWKHYCVNFTLSGTISRFRKCLGSVKCFRSKHNKWIYSQIHTY